MLDAVNAWKGRDQKGGGGGELKLIYFHTSNPQVQLTQTLSEELWPKSKSPNSSHP